MYSVRELKDFDLHTGDTFADHLELFCRAKGKVEDPASYEWASVVHADLYVFSVPKVGDSDGGSEREFAVCGRHTVHVECFAVRGEPSVELVSVIGCAAHLIGALGADF